MAADAEREAAERATRRQFFRLFGRQTASSAGSVLAGVAALRATGREALDELLGPLGGHAAAATGERRRPTLPSEPAGEAPAAPAADALRSPYRLEGDELLILDQRALPARVSHLRCRDASEVASAIRVGAAGAGPVLGQLAAYTLLLAAQTAADRSSYARTAALRGAAAALLAARPVSRAISAAVERTLAAAEHGQEDARAVRAEADLIAMEAALDHARLGQLAAPLLARVAARDGATAQRPLALLVHGDLGPLAGGMVGPGFAIIQSLATLGRPVHAWLTDGAPLMEGSRLAWQLEQLDVPATSVPDAGVGWLLANQPIDAALLRTEWIAANGDTVTALGGRTLAGAARERGVPVYAVAPVGLLDPDSVDGSVFPADLRMPSSDGAGARLDPAAEVLPHAYIDGILTDEGPLEPPYEAAIAAALVQRAQR